MNHRPSIRFSWFVLVFNVGVILVGAWVRASGSGAGCGRSWPTCQGALIPELEGHTAVEFTHRAVSGVALVLVVVLALMVWRATEKGHPARLGAGLSVVAIVGEALIGAMIVLAEWVAHDDSVARVVAVPLHLVNTLFLLAALALTISWLEGGGRLRWSAASTRVRRAVVSAGLSLVALAATGAITALADTLFPKGGDITGEAHFLTALRVVHPILALVVLASTWVVASRNARRLAGWVPAMVGLMALTGVINIALGVPIWAQLLHLVVADALWITFVLIAARALSPRPAEATASVAEALPD